MTFEFSYAVEYGAELDYETISVNSAALAQVADRTTNRKVWSLSIHDGAVSVSFACEGCRDRFVRLYERAVSRGAIDPVPGALAKRVLGRTDRPTCG